MGSYLAFSEVPISHLGEKTTLFMMQHKPHILVVDDDPRLLRLARVNLERAGFLVSTAAGGAAALDEMSATPPDAVVLDVTMPGIDGFTLTQQIREISNVPIMILTAISEQSRKVHGLEIGADDYMTKPFDPDELVAPAARPHQAQLGHSGAG